MWNIIKSQKYKIVGDNLIIYAILITLAINILGVLFDMDGSLSGSLYSVLAFPLMSFTLVLVSVVVMTRVMGWDMNDKTINYEIMSGHSRNQVFFARLFFGIVYSIIVAIIVALLPILIITVVAGWGNNADFAEVMKRFLVLLLPYIRWTCELAFLTVLAKNSNAALILGWVVYSVSVVFATFFEELTEKEISTWFFASNMLQVTEVSNSRMMLIKDEMVSVFDFSLKQDLLKNSIIASATVGVASIILAFMVFKKKDM